MKIAHVYIYGQIGSPDPNNPSKGSANLVSLQSVRDQIKAQPGFEEIQVHIHSPGGMVNEGFAIYDYLKSLSVPVTSIVEGSCFSIATVVALAGSTRLMTPHAQFLIHNPWGTIEGDSEEVSQYAQDLAITENKLADFYTDVVGINSELVRSLMKVETLMSPDEAIKHNFITGKTSEIKALVSLKTNINNPMNTITKEEFDIKFQKQTSMMNKLFDSITAISKRFGHKNLILQDSNGSEINFPDVMNPEDIKVGDKATLNGAAVPDGDYVMPSIGNQTLTFVNSEVTAITPSEEDEVAKLKEENAALASKLVDLEGQNTEMANLLKTTASEISAYKKEMISLKSSLGSHFNYDNKKNPEGKAPGNPDTGGRKRTPIQK